MAAMASALERKLVVVTGKGGVGKSTISAALGLAAARRGLRTIVAELGDQRRLASLLGLTRTSAGVETALAENLWGITIDPDQALLEWLQKLGGRVPGRFLATSGTFQYFAAAAPGARELVSMVKIWELTEAERWRKRARRYDFVVLDAPATGHALGLLGSPYTFGAITRVGPIFGQAEKVRRLLEDPARTGYLAVTHASEMAVGETLDLSSGLRSQLGRELHAAVANATLPRRFDAGELDRMAADPHSGSQLRRSAVAAARAVHDRGRAQQRQIARLRRHGLAVHGVPFVFATELDVQAVRRIGERLVGRL